MATNFVEVQGETAGNEASRQVSFPRRVLTTVAIAMAVIVVLLFFWRIAEVLLLIFAGLLLAVFLRGLANLLSRYTPLSSGWALMTVVLGLLLLVGGSSWLLAPGIAEQVRELQQSLPASVAEVQEFIGQYGWAQTVVDQAPAPSDLIPGPGDMFSQMTGIFSSTLSVLVDVFIVLIVGLYLAADPQLYIRGLLRLVPMARRGRAEEVLDALGKTLWWWLMARLMAMAVVGVTTALGLGLLGVSLALTLGLIAAVLDFIPNVGPVLATVPGVLVALLQSPQQALYVLILYIVVQQLESYVLTPILQQQTIKLPPVLSIAAVVIMSVLFGAIGLLLAAPLAAVVMVLVQKLYVEDVLGDKMSEA